MRLLNVNDLTFREFIGSNIPPYAIVSHRWIEGEETSHQEFVNGRRDGAGWIKISKGCSIAKTCGHEWLWIDTICIDSKSSAELTEAINSMYKWYRRSKECYVFLPDVYDIPECGCPEHSVPDGDARRNDRPEMCHRQFEQSTWFTRGWTLQELLAPENVYFLNARFRQVGNKASLCRQISSITNIGVPYVVDPFRIFQASVAQRMSWAASRETTREEDIAYSLLGIFDVNMPLLYGEGRTNAFLRLQVEIIRKSDDESIFAWWKREVIHIGLLAPDPSVFRHSSAVMRSALPARSHYEMTNKGLRFTFNYREDWPLRPASNGSTYVKVLFPLDCYISNADTAHWTNVGSYRLAIKAHGYVHERQRTISAYRVGSSTCEHSLIADRSSSNTIRDSMFTYDDCDFHSDFVPGDRDKPIIIIGAPDQSTERREQWQIYFSQGTL